jgi:cytosine/adenosine deaminase-related metal-dependent hydrolase
MKKMKQNKCLFIPDKIVTANSNNDILTGHAVEITDNIITSIVPVTDDLVNTFPGVIYLYENLVLSPGFVQTHIHLCQTLFRGLADDLQLLDWLGKKIFPFENAHNQNSLRASCQLGIDELLASGTTTILDMGTLNHQEVVFEELKNSGMRAYAGNCLIDINELYPAFKKSSEDNLKYTYDLAKAYHNYTDKIKFGFAPRFVLSCTEKLLIDIKAMSGEFEGSLMHTHSSENKSEIETVRRMTGKENIEYFDSINFLDDRTVLAHCIHLNKKEIGILKKHNTRVSHCPSSNLKLGSGIADIPGYLKEGISVSLGADGAPCNNNLSAFVEMRLAALIQKPIHGPEAMDALTVFRLATIEGAKALHLENEIGSIEVGKKADFVLLDLEKTNQPLNQENIYSSIVYSCNKENVVNVFIDGVKVAENGSSLLSDERELIARGRQELTELIKRIN